MLRVGRGHLRQCGCFHDGGGAAEQCSTHACGGEFVEAFFSQEKMTALENRNPQKYLCWPIVLLRMAVPVDMLSYLLGLFKDLSWKVYGFATLLGITPFNPGATRGESLVHFTVIGVNIF